MADADHGDPGVRPQLRGWALISPLGPLFREKGTLGSLSESDVALMVAVPAIVGSLGRIVVGALTDRYGGRVMFPIVSGATIVSILFTACFALDSYVAFSVYLPAYLKTDYALTPADAANRLAGFVVDAVIKRPVGGWLSDRIGPIPVLAAGFGVVVAGAGVAATHPLLEHVGATDGLDAVVPHVQPQPAGPRRRGARGRAAGRRARGRPAEVRRPALRRGGHGLPGELPRAC